LQVIHKKRRIEETAFIFRPSWYGRQSPSPCQMLSNSANIGIERLSTSDWRRGVYHRLLFISLAVTEVEFVQKLRYRNPFFLARQQDTFNSLFKTLRAH
jgi:hypothetical protein